ncbi:CPBP family intramembrane glutamic endopeptidase [Arthrospiribacter ruber]|uniref:CPBP family intramembrane metalloprotease n=1 Tax=Arthrospiribacter ruber TaxID=2487934 RepID=A0A951J2V1_9BACT|nr:CPBP family intramembrane glutamic endopeptidase [Arthrospiribacter ruber]MBW3469548.1 CPBP family intramembrane metalloprotease [Arthrospiribacter ruber]
MKKETNIRNLFIFIVIALIIGWAGVGIDSILPEQEGDESLGMAIWLVFPLLTVIVLRTFMGDGWKDAGLLPNFKGNGRWYFVALIIYPLVTAICLGIGGLTGWIDFSAFEIRPFLSVFWTLLGVNVIKNIFEESVWRGYLTVKLVKLKLSNLQLYLIIGLVWGLWHAPYYMVFLPEGDIQTVLPVGRIPFTIIAVLNMIVWTVMFTEIYRLTQSIWPVILMHAVEDALINHLVIDGYILIENGFQIWISPICGIIPNLLYLLIGLWLRRKRIQSKYPL